MLGHGSNLHTVWPIYAKAADVLKCTAPLIQASECFAILQNDAKGFSVTGRILGGTASTLTPCSFN
jgi:hypothetical protein